MKNITLKVDDETYRKARIRAAREGTSVSAMVREFLQREEDEEASREAKRIQSLEALYTIANQRANQNKKPVKPLSREEIYAERLH